MEFNKYGIVLEELAEEHLEMVRGWRNDPKISQHMVSQELITSEGQREWFSNLDQKESPHFVIKYKEIYVGLSSAKRQDINQTSCQTGMYIYHDQFASIAFAAACAQLDYCFENMGITEVNIYVKAENIKALRFNEALGYTQNESQNDPKYIYYTLTKEQYLKKRDKITRFFR